MWGEQPNEKFQSSHSYAYNQRPDQMLSAARQLAYRIREQLHSGERPILAYSGSSGIALATAISVIWAMDDYFEFGMAMVRKSGEHSHGRSVEIGLPQDQRGNWRPIAVFTDDHVSTGNTRSLTLRKLFEYYSSVNGHEWNKDHYIEATTMPVRALRESLRWIVNFEEPKWDSLPSWKTVPISLANEDNTPVPASIWLQERQIEARRFRADLPSFMTPPRGIPASGFTPPKGLRT